MSKKQLIHVFFHIAWLEIHPCGKLHGIGNFGVERADHNSEFLARYGGGMAMLVMVLDPKRLGYEDEFLGRCLRGFQDGPL